MDAKEKRYFWIGLAVVVALVAAFMFCAPAKAADADFYKRTGTKPPMQAKPFAQIQAGYLNGPLFGLGGGAKLTNGSEIGGMFLISRQSFAGGSCTIGCQTCNAPSSNSNHFGAVVTFRFP